MSMMRSGKPSVDGIKRLAKRIKAEKGLRYAVALDEAARAVGYQNYAHANRVINSMGQPAPGRGTSSNTSQSKENKMTRSDFQAHARETWVHAINIIAGPNAPTSISWTDRRAIVAALAPIMGHNRNHTHLPGGGGLDFEGVMLSPEAGCLDFSAGGRALYRVKPRRLQLERIDADPAQSFFLLELDTLEPSGVYPPHEDSEDERARSQFISEELVELTPGGDCYPRYVWDEGETPDGRKLPEDAKLVVRMLSGKLMFVTKGSIWNGTSSTYDGRHARMSAAALREVIERAVAARANAA